MKNKYLLISLLSLFLVSAFNFIVAAELVWFYADENGPLMRAEPPNGEVVLVQSPGNPHGTIHSERAKRVGYAECAKCHDGTNAVVGSDKFL